MPFHFTICFCVTSVTVTSLCILVFAATHILYHLPNRIARSIVLFSIAGKMSAELSRLFATFNYTNLFDMSIADV